MSYSSPSDVRLLVETSLADAEIEAVIGMSDAEVDRKLGSQDASDGLIRKLSALLTASAIKARQPSNVAVGEYREDAGDVLEVWGREVERICRLYRGVSVKASDYGAIEEEKRYPEA